MTSADRGVLFPLVFITFSWVTPDVWWVDMLTILVVVVTSELLNRRKEDR